MPCLNEEAELEATCASPGFDDAIMAHDAELMLVNNGSTDGTLAAMRRVKIRYAPGTVHLAHEAQRGYVPARAAGVREVAASVANRGIREAEALVIQADADTRYVAGYVQAMVQAARSARKGTLLEGRTMAPAAFVREHAAYGSGSV